MARYLLCEVSPQLIESVEGYDLKVTKVVVWETEHAFAEVSVDTPIYDSTLQQFGKSNQRD